MTAKRWKVLHRCLAVLWLLMAIPTLLWWKNSILWIAFMSIWANVASHWGAAQAAAAEAAEERR